MVREVNADVKIICCGVSLKKWALVKICLTLVISVVGVLVITSGILYVLFVKKEDHMPLTSPLYYIVMFIVGIVTSLLGIQAIKKNNLKYLTPFYYYLVYEASSSFFSMLLLVISPKGYFTLTFGEDDYWLKLLGNIPKNGTTQSVIVAVHSFSAVLMAFWWFIIRSFRHSMKKHSTK